MRRNLLKLIVVIVSLGALTFSWAESAAANSWINTRVPYDISVKELAERYYGDASEYPIIVEANKGLIGKDLIVRKDTEIKIPVTDKFTDQPEILGWN